MKFKNKKVIIFDLDGTLIDSAPDLSKAINHMLHTLKRKTFSEEIIHRWVGNGAKMLVERALSGGKDIDDSLDAVLAKEALDIFLNYYAQNLCVTTTTYPNVKETLKELKSKNYTLSIVTNKPVDFIEPILKGLKIDLYFESYLGGDSLQKRKPDPMPLLHICEKFNITAKQAVMIGDSKNDILAANSAQMQSIGLSYGYNYGEDISKFNPDIVFDNFNEILEVL